MKGFGKELILDLHNCKALPVDRINLAKFFKELCDEILKMKRAELHFWDYQDDQEGYNEAEDHMKGITAIQFIYTSSIVLHALDIPKRVYLNIFSCKDFVPFDATAFCVKWFDADHMANCHFMDRI